MPTYKQLSINGRHQRRYKNKRLDLQYCPQKKGICLRSLKTAFQKELLSRNARTKGNRYVIGCTCTLAYSKYTLPSLEIQHNAFLSS